MCLKKWWLAQLCSNHYFFNRLDLFWNNFNIFVLKKVMVAQLFSNITFLTWKILDSFWNHFNILCLKKWWLAQLFSNHHFFNPKNIKFILQSFQYFLCLKKWWLAQLCSNHHFFNRKILDLFWNNFNIFVLKKVMVVSTFLQPSLF